MYVNISDYHVGNNKSSLDLLKVKLIQHKIINWIALLNGKLFTIKFMNTAMSHLLRFLVQHSIYPIYFL